MQTSRLKLVRLTEDHVPGYHAIWSDPFTTRWSPHGHCATLEDSREWMSALLPDVNPKGVNYAVLLRADLDLDVEVLKARSPDNNAVLRPGGFLGWVGTWTSQPRPEVGLIFHRSTWGLGFATEALNAFLELFWKERPEFEHLEAWCDEENAASSNVLRKCGFHLVETIKGDYTLKWMVPELRNSLHFRARKPDSSSTT
ncbi:hypothetical protein N7481_012785 [Penicillium waksmanii]|uniref:uncharacterized protein n=1 Tax=Penicillium waksmanii TaxID=69791 RepID=UPI0025480515|nr:uncharacterized protein N7481_012785 [Penicillium waksmanii]KAJ5966071.1 hypothetical protein N7481_012785 [Penicillium waksmanii]